MLLALIYYEVSTWPLAQHLHLTVLTGILRAACHPRVCKLPANNVPERAAPLQAQITSARHSAESILLISAPAARKQAGD
jgi:hypothetical protein